MLKKGGKLLLKGGDADAERTATIADIRIKQKSLPVFNLEIANAHTYFVGKNGELAHNGWPCKLPRFNRSKPNYTVNPQHVPGPNFKPGKTPLPNDAKDVFKQAIPDDPVNPKNWFGKNSNGDIYRFSGDNAGGAHFSGSSNVAPGVRNITDYAKQRLRL